MSHQAEEQRSGAPLGVLQIVQISKISNVTPKRERRDVIATIHNIFVRGNKIDSK